MNYDLYRRSYLKIRPDADEDEIKRGYASEGIPVQDALAKGLGAGWYNTLGGFGTVGDMLGLPTGQWAEKQYQKAEEYALPQELQGYLWDKPELLSNPAWWAYQTGQTLPSVASSFLPGAAAAKGASLLPKIAKYAPAIGAGVAGLSGGAQEAAGTYRETGDLGQSLAFGAASSVLNSLPMLKVLQGGSFPSRLVKGALWEGATEYAEEPTEAVITGKDPIEAMQQGLNVIPGAFASALLMGGAGASMNLAKQAQGTQGTQGAMMPSLQDLEAAAQAQIQQDAGEYATTLGDQFDDDVKAAIADMMARPETFKIETPERIQLREQIRDKLYGQGAPRKERHIDFLIGPPAAGKSTIAEGLAKEHGAIIIDSDMAKEMLPEYDGGMGANAVHQESKQIADSELEKAIEAGDNIVVPIVGKDTDKVRRRIQALNKLGYTVSVNYVDLPIEKAVDRAITRFRKTGRFVSPEYINSVGTKPKATYEALKNEQAAQEFRAYSTDVQQGENARLLEELYPQAGEGRPGRRSAAVHAGKVGREALPQIESIREQYRTENQPLERELTLQPVKPVKVNDKPVISVLGNGIARDFKEKQVAPLLGQRITHTADLAALSQVYRDPRYETFRYFITNKDGEVVYQTGVTSRLPATTAHFIGDYREFISGIMDRMKADGDATLYFIHNHPSGDPRPSQGDYMVTQAMHEDLRNNGFKFGGHVVINHKTYGVLDTEGNMEVFDLPEGIDQGYDIEKPLKPHPVLGAKITSPKALAEVAKNIEVTKGHMTLIGQTSGKTRQRVQIVADVAPSQLEDTAALSKLVRELQLQSGSADFFLTGVPFEMRNKAVDAMMAGIFRDVLVGEGGESLASVGIFVDQGYRNRINPEPIAERVQQEQAPYGPRPVQTEPPTQEKAPFIQASQNGVSPEDLANYAKRGTQGWAETEMLAKALGTSPVEVDKFTRRQVGTAFNAEQLQQAANIVTQTWDATKGELIQMTKKLDEGNLSDKDLVRVQELLHEVNALQAQFMGVRGEAGRALNIFKKLKEATKVAEAAQMVADAHGGREMLEQKLRMIASMEDSGAGMRAIRTEMEATRVDQLLEWYVNSLVSGIPTHVVNMTSNLLVSGLEDITRFVAAGIGALHGGERVSMGEAIAHAAATLPGAVDGFKAFAEAIKNEDSPLQFHGKMDQPYRRAIPGTLGKAIRIPTRFLGAEDALFKTMAMTKELYALSARTGVPVDILKTNKEALDQAWEAGFKRTFTSKPGPVAQAILQLRRRHPIVNLVFPFVTTPANIVNYALKYTPAAVGYSEVRKDIAAGGVKRDLALARIATGSSIAAGIMGLAAMGLITGAPPEDPNKRRLWYAAGNQPYSLKIGDTWVSYSRLEPVGMLFGISSDMYRLAKTIGTDEADKLGSLIIGSVSNNLLSKTYLSGLSDMVNALTDPERYGENWIKRMVTGLTTPVFLSYTAKAFDPNLREAETVLDAIMARIPGMTKDLEPKLDVFGRERVNEGSTAYRFVSPAYLKKDIKDPVAMELLRLDVSTPEVAKKMQGVELSAKQRNELKKLLGGAVYGAVQRVIEAPGYKRLPDPAKAFVLDKVVSGVRRYGRLYWQMQHPEVMRQAKEIKVEEFLSRGG